MKVAICWCTDIKQLTKQFLQLNQFGLTAWDLILAIYESGWDKLNTLTDGNFTFRQQVSKQFSGKGNKAKNLGYSKFLGFSLQFLQDSFKAKSICDQNIKKKLENLKPVNQFL